jgi:beta-hydroxyacyl-ACP dehydratase FabZ
MGEINIEEIMKLLPHRYPMLLVDRVVECDGEKRIVGIKNVAVNEPFFQGHFPGYPVMPAVLQLEAMAQTAGILLNRISGRAGQVTYFVLVDKARFRKPVLPGDQLRIEVELTSLRSRSAKFRGRAFVGDALASEAEMMCMLGNEEAKE